MAENHWFWQSGRSSGRLGLNKLFRANSGPPNSYPPRRITDKLVSETFWPDTLDKESTKAARILYSFCKYGMYQDEVRDTQNHTTQKQKMWSRIPEDVIANAKGIVIFTVMRTGLWVRGAGGSGVVVARTANGSWSWPVAIEMHTAELGFLVGVDIYDCVLVLNTTEAVDAFTKSLCVIGGDLYATPGPLGVGWFFDKDARTRQAPIFSYLRSRGYYAAVQLDHAVVVERAEENRKFYQLPNVHPKDIFIGNHIHRPASCFTLLETLKASEGATEIDETRLPTGPPPSDFEVVEDGHAFGVPDREDPDPYGVLALEKQGLLIREAGTKTSPKTDSFDFNPSVTSPVYDKYNRRSADNLSVRSSWRRSSALSTGDRYDSSSIISRETDQESLGPTSPGLTPNYRPIQVTDNETKSGSGPGKLTNGDHQDPGEVDVKRESSSAIRAPQTNSRHQTIYEDEGEAEQTIKALQEPQPESSDMDAMVDELQSKREQVNGDAFEQAETAVSVPQHNADEERNPTPQPLTIKTSQLGLNDSKQDSGSGHDSELDSADLDEAEIDGPDSPVEIHSAVFQGGNPTSVYQAVSTITMPKARIVNVSKPAPPILPARNPGRAYPNSGAQSLDERSQPETSTEQISSKAADQLPIEMNSETAPSAESTAPSSVSHSLAHSPRASFDEPVSPIETLKTPPTEGDSNETKPRPLEENKKPEAGAASLMDIHKGLNASPSPEASSPEATKSYFS